MAENKLADLTMDFAVQILKMCDNIKGQYSKAAQEASRAGTPITLIDGNDLVRLVIKYQLHIKPIQTYELLDFYNEEE